MVVYIHYLSVGQCKVEIMVTKISRQDSVRSANSPSCHEYTSLTKKNLAQVDGSIFSCAQPWHIPSSHFLSSLSGKQAYLYMMLVFVTFTWQMGIYFYGSV